MLDAVIDAAVAGLLGGLLGLGELLARYRDEPGRAIRTLPAVFYIVLNATVGVLALLVIRVLGIAPTAGPTTAPDAMRLLQILLAGLGGMYLFRGSIFTLKVGNQDVALGPGGILQVILATADSGVDRLRAVSRDVLVSEVMQDIPFAAAREALPAYSFYLFQNLPAADKERCLSEIRELGEKHMDDRTKACSLGLILLNVVGEDVLRRAVARLRDTLQSPQDRDREAGSRGGS